ncbi:zinc transporter ZupT [compost metagenome]
MENTLHLTYGLLAASATMAGGLWVANLSRDLLTPGRLRGIMALGAGFLVALVLLELLPASVEQAGGEAHGVFALVLAAAAAVFAFDRWIAPKLSFLDISHDDDGCAHHHDYAHDHGHDHGDGHGSHADHAHAACGHPILGHGAACSALGCLAVCTFFDGVALSASFAAGSSLGWLVMVGLILHLLPEGILAASVTLAAGASKRMARRAVLIVGVALILGALMPFLMGSLVPFALPVAAGILLFVALAQLIPAAATTSMGAWLVLVGGGSFWLIEQLVSHGH